MVQSALAGTASYAATRNEAIGFSNEKPQNSGMSQGSTCALATGERATFRRTFVWQARSARIHQNSAKTVGMQSNPNAQQSHQPNPHRLPGQLLRGKWLMFLPSVALALLVAALVGLVLMVNWYETVSARNEFAREVQWVESAIVRRMLADQEFIDRIAGALGETEQISDAVNKDTDTFLANSPSVTSVSWNNAEGEPKWLRPLNRPLSSLIAERPSVEEKLRVARLVESTSRATYTQPYSDEQGNAYVQYHSPVLKGGKFLGTVNATYPLAAIMRHMVPDTFAGRAALEFVDGEGRALYTPPGVGRSLDLSSAYTLTVSVPWRDLKLRATPFRTVAA
jgi:two-component system, LuxR family, sensor histidine kinase DctS